MSESGIKKEFQSNCENCGVLEFDENERIWSEDESCYCRCGLKLKYNREYNGKVNTVGFNED